MPLLFLDHPLRRISMLFRHQTRHAVACRMERTRQTTDARHQLFHHQPAARRLKSQKSFYAHSRSSASSSRLQLWKDSLTDVPSSVKLGLDVAASLPAGCGDDWLCWRAINRMRTGVGRAKTMMRRWGYLDDAQLVDCDCGGPQTMAHLLSCRLLDDACTADDLATVTERAKACAANGRTLCEGHERRRSLRQRRRRLRHSCGSSNVSPVCEVCMHPVSITSVLRPVRGVLFAGHQHRHNFRHV